MFQNLEIFQMAQGMAQHAGRLQSLAAQNMANADTPGYAAKTITPFADTLRNSSSDDTQLATRVSHMNGVKADGPIGQVAQIIQDESARSDPNGNSVAIEDEILRAVDAKRQHDRALAIYRSSLNVLRTSIGRN